MKPSIEAWIGWIMATATASVTMVSYIHSNFVSKGHLNGRISHLEKQQDDQKEDFDKLAEKIELKLERLENKIDRILIESRK